jgi:acetoin utilization deacetylase AcuC-like enzyme
MTIPLITHPTYSYNFPGKHRFPMEKFALLAEYCHQKNFIRSNNLFRPGKARRELLEVAHCTNYLYRFMNNQQSRSEQRRMGLPWSKELLTRSLISPNGTFLTAQLALQNGIACHLAGGTHHAHFDFASGFCILNDLAITAKALLAQKKINKVVIFDCDVHQGDGTATILADEARAFTCSIHCKKNFPTRKAKSDLDIELAIDITEKQYLSIVSDTLTDIINLQKPDLILYDAGVDIFTGDPLGLLSISAEGISRREEIVLEICKDKNIPVATVIGGGYDDNRDALAERHGKIIEAAYKIYDTSIKSIKR